MKRLLLAALWAAALPAAGQENEVTLLGGFSTAGAIHKEAPSIEELEVSSGFAWGIAAGRALTPRLGVEVSWLRRESGVALATRSSRAELFDLNLDTVHGSVLYRFGAETARLRPFLSAGLGAAFFTAKDLQSETKLSLAVGGGVIWSPARRIGVRLGAAYHPTFLNDADSGYCDPFGFCQGWLHQLELTTGLSFAF